MVVTLPPLRSVFHGLCDVPAPSVFSAALPQLAPHNPYSNHPINAANGHCDDPLVIPGYSPSNRYQPYPQPQVLAPGQLLVFCQRKSTTRRGSRSQLVCPRIDSGADRPLAPTCIPYPVYTVDILMTDDFLLPTAGGCSVEISKAAGAPRVDVVDVEMEDDFPHPIPTIPAIIVTPPDE